MTPLDAFSVARAVVAVLDAAGIPYVIGGSVTASLLSEPRSTLNLDIMIDCDATAARELAKSWPGASSSSPDGSCSTWAPAAASLQSQIGETDSRLRTSRRPPRRPPPRQCRSRVLAADARRSGSVSRASGRGCTRQACRRGQRFRVSSSHLWRSKRRLIEASLLILLFPGKACAARGCEYRGVPVRSGVAPRLPRPVVELSLVRPVRRKAVVRFPGDRSTSQSLPTCE